MKLIARCLMLFSCVCLSSVAVTPATAVAARKKQTLEVADRLHTPPESSAERQAIMDALREYYKTHQEFPGQTHRGKITFHVYYLKVHNGWAWTYVDPHSSEPNEGFAENNGYLLHLKEGRWKVMNMPPMDDNQDGNLDPSPKDIQRIRKMYPSIPTDIFPSMTRR